MQSSTDIDLRSLTPAKSVFRPKPADAAPMTAHCHSTLDSGEQHREPEQMRSDDSKKSRSGLLHAIGTGWVEEGAAALNCTESLEAAATRQHDQLRALTPQTSASSTTGVVRPSAATSLDGMVTDRVNDTGGVSDTECDDSGCSSDRAQHLVQRLRKIERDLDSAPLASYDMREVMLLEEGLAVEAALRGPRACLPRAHHLCRAYNEVATRWLDAGVNVHIATQYIEKALIVSHPATGLLADDPSRCLPARLESLSNASCCMRLTGKPNLGLKLATEAMKLLKAEQRATSPGWQVLYARILLNRSACLSQTKHHVRALRIAQRALDLVLGVTELDTQAQRIGDDLVEVRSKGPAIAPGKGACDGSIGVAAAAAFNVACQYEHLSSGDKAAKMFLKASQLSEQAAASAPQHLARQLGQRCTQFMMKGVGVVPHSFTSRPKAAMHGAPESRFGFAYSDLRKTHPKPLLQATVPGPFTNAQVGFVPTRNALWNKPISFNAATLRQRTWGTYAAFEPLFETLLTRPRPAALRRIPGSEHHGLTPYRRQLKQHRRVGCNEARSPILAEESLELRTGQHARGHTGVSTFLSALQSKRSAEFPAAPPCTAVQEQTPLMCKPWRRMVRNEGDASIGVLSDMAAQDERLRMSRAASALSRRRPATACNLADPAIMADGRRGILSTERKRAASARPPQCASTDQLAIVAQEPWRSAFACV